VAAVCAGLPGGGVRRPLGRRLWPLGRRAAAGAVGRSEKLWRRLVGEGVARERRREEKEMKGKIGAGGGLGGQARTAAVGEPGRAEVRSSI
jgi:hypothetical protein